MKWFGRKATEPLRKIKSGIQRRVLNKGYSEHGASFTKTSMLGWMPNSGTPKEDMEDNLQVLRERSRDLYYGAPLANGAIKTQIMNNIGPGLRHKANIDGAALGMDMSKQRDWEKACEREFEIWMRDCDARGQLDFYGIQRLAMLSQLLSGEVFALFPMYRLRQETYSTKIMLIESDFVGSPNGQMDGDYRSGVKLNRYGAPVGYFIYKESPYTQLAFNREGTYVPKYGAESGRLNVLHLLDCERPGQVRGMPAFAPVMETLKQLTRYTDAELMKALVSSTLTAVITTQLPDMGSVLQGAVAPFEEIDSDNPATLELGAGTVAQLAPGEDVKTIAPSPISNAFDDFVVTFCRQVGAALEIPYEILVKHFTASYSASRAALLEYWKSVRARRASFIRQFCEPIYELWMDEAVASGRLDAPGYFSDVRIKAAYQRASWYGPAMGQIDPLKEANAAVVRVDNLMSTRTKETAEITGEDFGDVVDQLSRERQMIEEGGLQTHEELQSAVDDFGEDGIEDADV